MVGHLSCLWMTLDLIHSSGRRRGKGVGGEGISSRERGKEEEKKELKYEEWEDE